MMLVSSAQCSHGIISNAIEVYVRESMMAQATTNDMTLSQLGQIAVPVQDLERATAFYRDTLRVPFLFAFPGLTFFDCAGVRLMLSVPEAGEVDPRASVLYFRVHDLDATYRTLVDRGVSFIDEPHLIAAMPDHELWMVFFRDS